MNPQNHLRKKILSELQSKLFWSSIESDLKYSTISIKQIAANKADTLSIGSNLKLKGIQYRTDRKLNKAFFKTL